VSGCWLLLLSFLSSVPSLLLAFFALPLGFSSLPFGLLAFASLPLWLSLLFAFGF
jgi:hypothetical protein